MKKVLALVLALALFMMATGALADIVICQNKVEIDPAMQEYAKLYTEKTGVPVKVITGGGSSDYNTVLKAEMQSGREPDIWVIEGSTGYELWKDKIADLAGSEWIQYTDRAYMDGDKVVGFPVALEGYGLAYNADILAKAGIDPATLTNFDAIKAAFEKIDSMKAELGLDMVVSMVAGTTTGMTWVTGLHNFNLYLTVGTPRDDQTYISQVLQGKVDEDRFHQYCQYVGLLFQYSTQDMLLNGTQDAQMVAFLNGKAAFYHQGNWMDPNILKLPPVDFEIGYCPHAFLHEDTDGVIAFTPSWYVVNVNGNVDEAKAYLDALVTTEEGRSYMVEKAGMVSAYSNINLNPVGPLSLALMKWTAADKVYGAEQYQLPDGFGMGTLGQIYELFAAQAIDADTFEIMMKDAIAGIAK
ncbi:MAG: ABC transporter substrate-binding protein [Clostridia bacterium]|nr:ABC transporter substrate-binding protein [Clostridia bacterium]